MTGNPQNYETGIVVAGSADGAESAVPETLDAQTENKIQTVPDDLAPLKALFHEELDFNNSGKISRGEFRYFIHDMALTDAQFLKVFSKFDAAQTGWVSLDELLFMIGAQFVMWRKGNIVCLQIFESTY